MDLCFSRVTTENNRTESRTPHRETTSSELIFPSLAVSTTCTWSQKTCLLHTITLAHHVDDAQVWKPGHSRTVTTSSGRVAICRCCVALILARVGHLFQFLAPVVFYLVDDHCGSADRHLEECCMLRLNWERSLSVVAVTTTLFTPS